MGRAGIHGRAGFHGRAGIHVKSCFSLLPSPSLIGEAQIPFPALVLFLDFLPIWGQLILVRNKCPLLFPLCVYLEEKKINCRVQYNQIYLLPGSRHALAVGLAPIPSPNLLTSLSCLAGDPFRRAPRAQKLMCPIFRSSWLWMTSMASMPWSHGKANIAGRMCLMAGFFFSLKKLCFGERGRSYLRQPITPTKEGQVWCWQMEQK